MRHTGRSKAGFYPTPIRVVELLAKILILPKPYYSYTYNYELPKKAAFLDPTCGDGKPLGVLKELLLENRRADLLTFGIELDKRRAAQARKYLYRVATGDAMGFKASGFSLLFLNPPYDSAGNGKRVEVEFLKRYTEALVPDGVLVYIIPENSLPLAASYILSNYSDVRAIRFPHPEYDDFKQIVVLGYRRSEPVPVYVSGIDICNYDLARYVETEGFVYKIPGREDFTEVRLEDHGLDPATYLEISRSSGAWDTLSALTRSVNTPVKDPPLVPMSTEHLALVVAAGHLNGTVIETPDGPLLLRGRVKKIKTELPEEDRGDKTVKRVRESYRSVIHALNLNTLELTEVS